MPRSPLPTLKLCALLLCLILAPPLLSAEREDGAVVVYILAGQSNMEGHGQTRSLPVLAESADGRELLALLRDANGEWRSRDDVTMHWPGHRKPTGPLGPGWGYGAEEVGPELGFGALMGERHEEHVLLIKVAWGGKDVFCDFRAPSAAPPAGDEAALLAKERANGNEREVGAYYRRMLADIRGSLASIETLVPGAARDRVRLGGFAWFQGWNDYCRWHERDPADDRLIGDGIIEAYPGNLAAMIRDLRSDLHTPELPVVIGEMGIGGVGIDARAKRSPNDREAHAIIAFREAQRRTLEERGMTRVSFVPTVAYWDDRLEELREIRDRWEQEKRKEGIPSTAENELPTAEQSEEYRARGGHWYCHYNGSAANYVRVGAALARSLPSEPGAPAD